MSSGFADFALNSSSKMCLFGNVSDLNLGLQASVLLTAGTDLSSSSTVTQVSSSQGRPAFVILSFVSTFAPLSSSFVQSCRSTESAVACQAGLANPFLPLTSTQILLQPFVVGPGFSPISAKLVGQITAGKFVEISELLPSNIASMELTLHLLFDGHSCV